MSRPIVLLLGEPPIYQTELWKAFEANFRVVRDTSSSRDAFIAALKENKFGAVSAILKPSVEAGNIPSPWNKDLISLLPPSVRLFSAAGAGFDYLDLPSLNARDITFTNGRGAGDTATSDLALYLILSVFRLTSYAEFGARSGDPKVFDEVHNEIAKKAVNPKGRVLGAVGLGAIQKEIVRKVGYTGLGMKVLYYDVVRASPEVEEKLQAEYVADLLELARRSDCISVSVPYLDSTHHLINKEFLDAMKPGSRIVNTSRGKVIHEAELVSALESGHLLSAGLDVHYDEPKVLPKLIAMRNVTLTAHIGGVAQDTHSEFERLCLTNVDNFLRTNEPLLTEV
ncbi:D-mandelate dehydrogenase [Leucosporidium creatinivorum]|uniref:D-mandelate dehydrogenase n=1 Tax=Leucosporidium creatinivorum TaxID=106004 RepID=A0A1Y2EZ29_9BASI|nr:D-mandelate dehydrogenase [Leucosporidium creatinivorum]